MNTHKQMIKNMKIGESERPFPAKVAALHKITVEQVTNNWRDAIAAGLCELGAVHGEMCLVRK